MTGKLSRQKSLSVRRFGGRHTWSGALVAAAAVISVIILGTASAGSGIVAAPLATMKWAKPYAGFEGDQIVTQTSGCGVKLSFPVLPFFNMTTGKGVASTKVAAKSCLHANSTATSSLTMGFESDRFGVASIGTYHLKVTGVLDFSIDISASSGGFAQLPEAGYTVSLGFEYLNDTTSGTLYTDTYTSEMTGMTTRGTTSTTFTETWSSYLNASLSPGEVYQFVVGFTITAFVFVPVGSSSASASVNMGSAGMKATLSNVVLT